MVARPVKNAPHSMRSALWFLGLITISILAACGGGGGGGGGGSSGSSIASIAITPASPVTFEDGALPVQLTTTVKDKNGNAVSGASINYSVSDSTIATVDNTGKVTGIAPGTVQITATAGPVASNTVNATVVGLGALKGSVNFPGPYPNPYAVSYLTASGAQETAEAYPGQVIVSFDMTLTDAASAEAAIAANSGTTLEKIPKLGFYVVKVAVGTESAFMTKMNGITGVEYSTLNQVMSVNQAVNGPVVSSDDSGTVDLRYLNQTNGPVVPLLSSSLAGFAPGSPINNSSSLTSLVALDVIDMKNSVTHHMDETDQSVIEAGGTIHANILLPVPPDGSSFSDDQAVKTIASVMEGRMSDTPAHQTWNQYVLNTSFGAGNKCNVDSTVSCASDTSYGDRWEKTEKAYLKSIAAEIAAHPDQANNIVVVRALGNGDQDITANFKSVYEYAGQLGVTQNIVWVGAKDTLPSGEAATKYPNGTYSTRVGQYCFSAFNCLNYGNIVMWYPGVLRDKNGNFVDAGTSFSAPRVSALLKRVSEANGIPVTQATPLVNLSIKACLNTPLTGTLEQCVLNQAQVILSQNNGSCSDPDADVFDDPDCD